MAQPERLDGRRARREHNADAVVDAMLDLLGEGVESPGAAAVAERSGVSLRSVFRYFDDMGTLTQRAIARQMERAGPLFDLLDDSGDTTERAQRLAAHRWTQYDQLAPYARVAMARADRDQRLALGLAVRRDALRRQVEALFVAELDGLTTDERALTLDTLEAVSGFEVVELLVRHRGLDRGRVTAVLTRAVLGTLAAQGS